MTPSPVSLLARRVLPVLALVGVLTSSAATAFAGPAEDAWWKDHPGVALATVAAIGLLVAATLVGVGCLVAAMGAAFPRLQGAMDRRAREGGGFLSGSLVLVGTVGAAAALAQAGPVGQGAGALLVLAAGVLALGGALGTFPLVGERVLGARGASASPLRRSLVGTVVLGLAVLPTVVLRLAPVAFLLGLLVVGWPLGVALRGVLARTSKPAPPPQAPPP